MNRRAVKNLPLALATVFVSSLAQAGDLLQRITQEKQITVATEARFAPFESVENGKIVGRMRPTGIRPKFMHKFEQANIYLPPNIFGVGERFWMRASTSGSSLENSVD